ncbi:MAG: right-handed parallel beta-helix repeat-containing protein [Lyngbya sp. HA4199-MV5]|nr:right-handed parallel beta-helix repeat-containing protein [Lyngbya sp. HA4199-MV5]
MSAKNLTRVTVCAASLLLAEVVSINAAQASDQPIEPGDDAAPITSESNRQTLFSAHRVALKPIGQQLSQSEQFNHLATLTTQPHDIRSVAIAPKPSEVIPPPRSEAIPVQSHAIAQYVASPGTIAQPETIPLSIASTNAGTMPQPAVSSSNSTKIVVPTAVPSSAVAISTRASDLEPLPSSTIAPSLPFIAQTPSPTALIATPPVILPQVGASFTAGDSVGVSNSFGSLNGFVPIQQTPGRNITFVEGQVSLSTEGANPSANLAVGHRFYDGKGDRIYGGYLAFDHRDTGSNGFNQIGLGLETLGNTWDARANVYLPVGDTRQLASERISNTVTATSNPFFQSNFLAINRTIQQQISQRFEAAGTGFDVEAGGKIAALGRSGDLRGYGGLYYFSLPGGDDTVGVRARLEARPTDTLQLGLTLSNDNTFGTNLAFTVGITFPQSRPRRDKLKTPLVARLGDSISRNPNIVIDTQTALQASTRQETTFVTNPATGQPWQFRHANLGIGTGDGTFENPTGTVAAALAVAQPNDIVYVQAGTNPGIPAFTIPDDVQVLSTGPVQRIDTIELGNLPLPLSGAGVLPTVQGTVTLGNHTTLSGFAIGTATGSGIAGNSINTVTVRDNAIANTAAEGILFTNVQGTVTVQDNSIRQAGGEGFSLANDQGQVDLVLTRNQITNNGSTATEGDGVKLALRTGATGNFTITNNTIANNSGTGGLADGVDVKLFDAANGTFNLADNAITGNQLNGVAIDLEATTQGTFNLSRNTISSNQAAGVATLLSNDAIGTFNLDGNTIANNQLKGVQVVVSDRANGTLNLTNTTITGNQADGFFLQTSDQARATAQLLNSSITNNTNYGIFTTANGTSQLRLLTNSTTITGNGFAGISINTDGSASSATALRTNTITGNTFGDVEVFTNAPGATACLQPLNNTIGSLLLDDSFGGSIAVEANTLPTNTITTTDFTFWSGTTVAPNSCGL